MQGSTGTMSKRPTKGKLIDWARRERAGWELLLADVGEAHMNEPGPMGGWTFRDLLAHLMVWQQYAQAPLEQALLGECPAPPWPADLNPEQDQNRINQIIYERTRDLPWPALLSEARAIWMQLEDGLFALSEAALIEPHHFTWTNGEPLGPMVIREVVAHYHQDHEVAVRMWLAGFRAPVDEG
jgi:hypothetical protein